MRYALALLALFNPILAPPTSASTSAMMTCPAPEHVQFGQSRFRADDPTPDWPGVWLSAPHTPGTIQAFKEVTYYADEGRAKGILSHCTYELTDGQRVDLTYYPPTLVATESLEVSLDTRGAWRAGGRPARGAYYHCSAGVRACAFRPLRRVAAFGTRVDPSSP